jgi:hypothetical protein
MYINLAKVVYYLSQMFMVSENGTFKDFKNIHRFQKCSQVQKKSMSTNSKK